MITNASQSAIGTAKPPSAPISDPGSSASNLRPMPDPYEKAKQAKKDEDEADAKKADAS